MSVIPKPKLEGPRWSAGVLCERIPVYQHRGEPELPLDPVTAARFWRGKVVSDAVTLEEIAQLRREGRRPRAEEAIPWPAADPVGEGHADLYVPHEKGIVEVTTCVDASPGPWKFLQAAGYVLNHPNAEQGSVYAVDANTGERRIYPIDVDGLEPRVRAIEDSIVEAIHGGDMPPRVAKHPGAWPCSTCVFRETCWQDWERPERDILLSDPGLERTAEALADVKQTVSEAQARINMLKPEVKRLEAELALDVPVGEEVEVGSVLINSWHVGGKRSLDFAALENSGHAVPDELAPFVKTSDGYDRWTAKRLWKGETE